MNIFDGNKWVLPCITSSYCERNQIRWKKNLYPMLWLLATIQKILDDYIGEGMREGFILHSKRWRHGKIIRCGVCTIRTNTGYLAVPSGIECRYLAGYSACADGYPRPHSAPNNLSETWLYSPIKQ
ncbi:hypothetical protein KFK09_018383 [Dendrobium nobile]|uniref:Uncharacterized protein n=1 Tax=Dendrobium nobile TaxID=94219 RepID=A0A8T3AVT2_DENNO|nr:hypothetical protein KFK09_018383 [Dendrobium nobile]